MGDIIVQSHQNYVRALNKRIAFELKVDEALPLLHVYTVLSLVNNLVSNAVESIKDTGLIKIAFRQAEDHIEFWVADNGPGIPLHKRNVIFKPGYTTKFDLSGNPSTGMGLPYIKHLANTLHGDIILQPAEATEKTVFVIKLPLKSVAKEA
jgi:two-component system sensor histidine kinase YcbA